MASTNAPASERTGSQRCSVCEEAIGTWTPPQLLATTKNRPSAQ